ncbi:membrane protein insertase YidC [Scopulibacillus cellulosilyticus]|uniref:Membrane protein insertase YidC n=1 Tax=Scopulibacillus cellulosilyticus TaxID=2665665 RepID=A0ABW2Q387_9BACL
MRKKIAVTALLLLLVAVLSGCNDMNQPITSHSTGIWNEYFVFPLSWFITTIANFFNGSYGLAIAIVTIIVRLVLMPLMVKQTKNSIAMQEIQPKIAKLKEKYSSKDQKTQQKLQQEQMKLFQEHNVNPLAGCLPLIIQMPVLIALYHAIMRTQAIKHSNFLWFSLGHPDPYYIMPVVVAAATFVQQKVLLGKTGNANPQMAMMTYIYPIIIGGMAIYFPSALALYWLVGNVWMIFQTYILYSSRDSKKNKKNEVGGAKK